MTERDGRLASRDNGTFLLSAGMLTGLGSSSTSTG